MAIIENGTRSELTEGLKADAYDFVFEELKRPEYSNPIYKQIYTVIAPPTGDEGVENSALINVGFKKTSYGEAVQDSSPSEARKHPYKLQRFSAAQSWDRDMIEKDSTKEPVRNIVQNFVKAAIKRLMTQKETYFHNAFNKGALTAGHEFFNQSGRQFNDTDLLYDGLPLLNLTGNARTMLKTPDSGVTNSFYNLLGTSGVALSATQFNNAWVLMHGTNIYGDDGAPDPFMATDIIVHPSEWLNAMQIAETQSGLPNETNNGMNPFRGRVNVISSPFITTSSAWFLFSKTDLWEAIEEPVRIDFWFDNFTKKYWASVEARYTARIKTWRNIVGANLATS